MSPMSPANWLTSDDAAIAEMLCCNIYAVPEAFAFEQ